MNFISSTFLNECVRRLLTFDFDIAEAVDFVADAAQDRFQVAAGLLKAVGIDGQWSADDDQRRAVGRRLNGLVDRQTTDSLYGNLHRVDNFAKLIQGCRAFSPRAAIPRRSS